MKMELGWLPPPPPPNKCSAGWMFCSTYIGMFAVHAIKDQGGICGTQWEHQTHLSWSVHLGLVTVHRLQSFHEHHLTLFRLRSLNCPFSRKSSLFSSTRGFRFRVFVLEFLASLFLATHRGLNNRSARAFYILVHFFAVLCKTTMWNDQINFRFSRERERMTASFYFVFFASTPFTVI